MSLGAPGHWSNVCLSAFRGSWCDLVPKANFKTEGSGAVEAVLEATFVPVIACDYPCFAKAPQRNPGRPDHGRLRQNTETAGMSLGEALVGPSDPKPHQTKIGDPRYKPQIVGLP